MSVVIAIQTKYLMHLEFPCSVGYLKINSKEYPTNMFFVQNKCFLKMHGDQIRFENRWQYETQLNINQRIGFPMRKTRLHTRVWNWQWLEIKVRFWQDSRFIVSSVFGAYGASSSSFYSVVGVTDWVWMGHLGWPYYDLQRLVAYWQLPRCRRLELLHRSQCCWLAWACCRQPSDWTVPEALTRTPHSMGQLRSTAPGNPSSSLCHLNGTSEAAPGLRTQMGQTIELRRNVQSYPKLHPLHRRSPNSRTCTTSKIAHDF